MPEIVHSEVCMVLLCTAFQHGVKSSMAENSACRSTRFHNKSVAENSIGSHTDIASIRIAWRLLLLYQFMLIMLFLLIQILTKHINANINLCNFICLQNKIEDHRRKWDPEEYERLAQERLLEEEDTWESGSGGKRKDIVPTKRELLKPRSYKVCSIILCSC